MYQPSHYKKNDPGFIREFIEKHPFAVMVSRTKPLIATHIPVLVEENAIELLLYGHIANHNEQIKSLQNGAEVLLIFSGPHGYISSSWYQEADISTWNYAAVHVNAEIQIQTDEELENSLKKLVDHFESPQQAPVKYEDLPSDLIQSHMPRITGFWLHPFKVQAISKMSQNKSAEDVESVLDHLQKEEGTRNLCEHIKKENEATNT